MDRLLIKEQCEVWRRRYTRGQRAWSTAHHVSIFGSIICSIAAGVFIQIADGRVFASALTAAAAALTGMAAAGGFMRKWRSNRMSRSRIDAILLDLEDESFDTRHLALRLKNIISEHDEVVTTAAEESSTSEQTGRDVGTPL